MPENTKSAEALRAILSAEDRRGGYDPARRRRCLSAGRQRGCYIYIPAAVLRASGFTAANPPATYRTWGGRRGSVLLRLYRETL